MVLILDLATLTVRHKLVGHDGEVVPFAVECNAWISFLVKCSTRTIRQWGLISVGEIRQLECCPS